MGRSGVRPLADAPAIPRPIRAPPSTLPTMVDAVPSSAPMSARITTPGIYEQGEPRDQFDRHAEAYHNARRSPVGHRTGEASPISRPHGASPQEGRGRGARRITPPRVGSAARRPG